MKWLSPHFIHLTLQIRSFLDISYAFQTNDMGEPQKGCPYPCLTGRAGYLDGGWNLALFDYPYDIAIDSEEKSLWITDRHFVRKFDFDSMHVSTIAGSLAEGERDGEVSSCLAAFLSCAHSRIALR